MSAQHLVATALMLFLLGGIAGWCAGWVARGEQNRLFHANQLRIAELTARAREHPVPAPASVAEQVARPTAQTVVHVHLQLPPSREDRTLDVIDGQIVRALEDR